MTHNIHKMHKVYFSICSLAACHKIIYKFGWNKLIFSRCCASNHQLVNETLNLNELLWKATSLQKLNHTTQFEDLTLTRKGWTLVINVSFVFFLMTWNTRAECRQCSNLHHGVLYSSFWLTDNTKHILSQNATHIKDISTVKRNLSFLWMRYSEMVFYYVSY